jgi:hypothetical protein
MIQLNSKGRSLAVTLLTFALAVPALASTAFADVAQPAGEAAEVQGVRAGHTGTRVNVVGEVARYVVGPLGKVRGFLLKDGTAVMVHGEAGEAMAKAVPVGQSVRVEGWSPSSSGGKTVMRAAVYGQHGQVVAPPTGEAREQGRGARGERWNELKGEIARLPDASANGTVQTVIQGHRGKIAAVVLSDGTSVFLRPRLAKALMTRGIQPGDRIESSGKGASYPLGKSVVVSSITFADGTRFEAAPPAER